MTSSITRTTTLTDREVTVEIKLVAKDATDDALIQKFGDIIVTPSGLFWDINDASYPKFNVQAGDPVNFYTDQVVRALFVDDTLTLDDLQKRAKLWGDTITASIQASITTLRAANDTSTGASTIVI